MTWTEKQITAIRALWAEGYSFSQIAAEVGGVSRNAVGAKLHRLGLLGNAPQSRKVGPSTGHVHVLRPPKLKMVTDLTLDQAPAPLGLPNEFAPFGSCRWIHGDPGSGDWCMCGHVTVSPAKPWCGFHAQRARA